MAKSLRANLLPLIDKLRGLPGELGFRPYSVSARVTTWSGGRPGVGVKTTTDTRLLVGKGQDPKVREVNRKDVVGGDKASVEAQYDIGPLTPEYAGGGIAESIINPELSDVPTEGVFFVLKGPGMPETGLLCKRVGDHMDHTLRMMVRVASLGRAA